MIAHVLEPLLLQTPHLARAVQIFQRKQSVRDFRAPRKAHQQKHEVAFQFLDQRLGRRSFRFVYKIISLSRGWRVSDQGCRIGFLCCRT